MVSGHFNLSWIQQNFEVLFSVLILMTCVLHQVMGSLVVNQVFLLTWKLIIRSDHNFAHAMTAVLSVLSWQVQNCELTLD